MLTHAKTYLLLAVLTLNLGVLSNQADGVEGVKTRSVDDFGSREVSIKWQERFKVGDWILPKTSKF